VPVHYVEQGEGSPLLALHGAGVDHREVMACLEPVFDALTGHRRIYVDLPGMGLTPLQRRSVVRTTSSMSCWNSSKG
jgi:pimeloyl-ACP methyl ester carboxylesterase